ncbi:pyrophosphate-energized vacuolar membrane proton pump-like [Sesbania bispinosa]|nr:pyrophosphate-energized vacuolar membrane proton pump-like [Sesbania bispinosa]
MIGRCLSVRLPFSGCSVVKQLAGGVAPLGKDVMQGCAKILPHVEIIQKMQRKDVTFQVHHLRHRNTSNVVLGTTKGGRFSTSMSGALLSKLATEIVVPVCAVIGNPGSSSRWCSGSWNKNSYSDYLIEEEEVINDHNVVFKSADIQSAISEGKALRFGSEDIS